jgi:hypothetical protein
MPERDVQAKKDFHFEISFLVMAGDDKTKDQTLMASEVDIYSCFKE